MNKLQAKKKVFDYFKKNAIEYKFVNEELKLIDVDSLDTIYLCASIPEVIGGHIETCIRLERSICIVSRIIVSLLYTMKRKQ